MRTERTTWRQAKITPKFIKAKAIALMALRRGSMPVKDTGSVLKRCKDIVVFAEEEHISQKMFREALHDLAEQGFVDWVGGQYGMYWYSIERLV